MYAVDHQRKLVDFSSGSVIIVQSRFGIPEAFFGNFVQYQNIGNSSEAKIDRSRYLILSKISVDPHSHSHSQRHDQRTNFFFFLVTLELVNRSLHGEIDDLRDSLSWGFS